MARTSETNKGFNGILVDASQSMTHHARSVATIVNHALLTMLFGMLRDRTAKVRDLVQISLLDFGGHGVASAIQGGALAGREIVSIRELEDNPAGTEPAAPGVDASEVPIWVSPRANGETPMREALERMNEIVTQHRITYPKCQTPIVALLTDGQPTTGDILPAAEELKKQALLLCCYFDSSGASPTLYYPSDDRGLNRFAQLLFQASSEIPQEFIQVAQSGLPEKAQSVVPGSRGLIFGGGLPDVSRFFDFLTRTQVAQATKVAP